MQTHKQKSIKIFYCSYLLSGFHAVIRRSTHLQLEGSSSFSVGGRCGTKGWVWAASEAASRGVEGWAPSGTTLHPGPKATPGTFTNRVKLKYSKARHDMQ